MNTKSSLAPLVSAALWAVAAPAHAVDKVNIDWPCVQRKVENINVSQVWDGPSIDGLKGWWEDKELNAVIESVANRRVDLKEAEEAIKAFAGKLPAADKDPKLTLLFAGLFDKVGTQRRAVVNGLEKFLRSQRDRAKDIEDQGAAIAELEAKAQADEKAAAELAAAQEKFEWATRIFQERQQSIPVACELPVIIDARLYDLARTIRTNMSK